MEAIEEEEQEEEEEEEEEEEDNNSPASKFTQHKTSITRLKHKIKYLYIKKATIKPTDLITTLYFSQLMEKPTALCPKHK